MKTSVTYFTITHNNILDWWGEFFREDQKEDAKRALLDMQRELQKEPGSKPQALYLEAVTIPLPINEEMLFELLNGGPLVVFGDRKIIDVAYVS
jgi:hypothetical protein